MRLEVALALTQLLGLGGGRDPKGSRDKRKIWGGSSTSQELTPKKEEKFSVTQNLKAALGEGLGGLVLSVPQMCALGLRNLFGQLG